LVVGFMGYEKKAFQVREILKRHHRWMEASLPLIASENLTSLLVRETTASDFAHRYAEGRPGMRFYKGCRYIDEVELLAVDLAKKLFGAEYVNVLPPSGTIANLAVYSAFSRPGDIMMALEVPNGGHISHAELSAAGIRGLKVVGYPFDPQRMKIDVDRSIKKILEVRPRILLFGGSLFLFPHPVRELREVATEVGATVVYDAAHVLGLIAGKQFQLPFEEGADIVSTSRHKTFPGPQGGLILSRDRFAPEISKAVFPGLVSNHHLHHLAGLAVALAEMLEFGEAYAWQTIRNARALAEALHERGFHVLAEEEGFTASHQVAVNVTELGGGGAVADALEEANIICNKNLLPGDTLSESIDPSGIRMGVQELTRLGMVEGDMEEVAELIKRTLIDGEEKGRIREAVLALKKDLKEVKFSFDRDRRAYEYVEFF
jgi:glycine hydroxymethyltransferase